MKSKHPKAHKPERRNHGSGDGRVHDAPGYDDLVKIFKQCGLNLSDDNYEKFWRFHKLLRARKDELDLTRIHRFEKMVLKHYVDCALIPGLVDLPQPLLDIGTGAGFPGIPIKIMRPDLKMILAEGRGKRLEFLEEAIQELALENVELFPHKVTSTFDLNVNGVITRDFESVKKTLERTSVFLPERGRLFFLKGPSVGDELSEAGDYLASDFKLLDDIEYRIGDTDLKRRLVVIERTHAPALNIGGFVERSNVREIASAKNNLYKTWTKLLDGRGPKKHGMAVMSGLKQVNEMIRDFPDKCLAVLGTGRKDPEIDVPESIEQYRLRPELFRDLDVFGTGAPLLIVKAAPMPEWRPDSAVNGCTLFIPFQDPSNVGAVIRTAAALGVSELVLLEEAANPYHPRCLRTAGPTVFRAPLLRGPSITSLDPDAYPFVALGLDGKRVDRFSFPDKFGLIPGVEGPGLPENLKNINTVTIPMQPGVESLNAAAASAIVLYEWRRQIAE